MLFGVGGDLKGGDHHPALLGEGHAVAEVVPVGVGHQDEVRLDLGQGGRRHGVAGEEGVYDDPGLAVG